MNAIDKTARSELLQPGQSFGKFYLVQAIGEGGTSRIYKALQQPINRLVALKIPSFSGPDNILTPDEFLSEATLMARLEHPNVIHIYDFGVSEERAFICMEYVDGSNLQERVESHGPLSLSATLALGLQTLEGLIHSHSKGVLHLDLSPANLLISKTGSVKLSDFGMAGKKPTSGPSLVVGTPAFLSPEHVNGNTATTQSDLFSFGSLLFFAATGKSLFEPDHGPDGMSGMLRTIATARENPPLEKLRSLPQLLSQIILSALTDEDEKKAIQLIREGYAKLEGSKQAAMVLSREMDFEGLGSALEKDDLPKGEDLRVRYFELRESGYHREAVAMLERAIRRQPNNPILAELLAAPPAKAKSSAVTVAVGEISKFDVHLRGKSISRRSRTVLMAMVGIVAVTLGIWKWGRSQILSKPKKEISSTVSSHSEPSLPVPVTVAVPEPIPSPTSVSSLAPRNSKMNSVPEKGARVKPVKLVLSKPPALFIDGPAGTHVFLNDSVEWVSPSPKGGWILHPGLVNLTIALPGSSRPITSSLFLSSDSLYRLRLETDGGFSVTHEPR